MVDDCLDDRHADVAQLDLLAGNCVTNDKTQGVRPPPGFLSHRSTEERKRALSSA